MILLAAGRPAEAVAAYERALALRPDLASSREGKAQALRALGRGAEAEATDGGDSPE